MLAVVQLDTSLSNVTKALAGSEAGWLVLLGSLIAVAHNGIANPNTEKSRLLKQLRVRIY
jgi:hypothetical protein